jgi:hypothetical protein
MERIKSLALAAAARSLGMAATAPSRISLRLAQTFARRVIPPIAAIPSRMVLPWLLRILPEPWRCYGRLFPACNTRSRRVVMR